MDDKTDETDTKRKEQADQRRLDTVKAERKRREEGGSGGGGGGGGGGGRRRRHARKRMRK